MATLSPRKPSVMPSIRKPRERADVTYEQFLQLDLGHDHIEWVDGKVVAMSAVEADHEGIAVFLTRVLSDWLDANDGGRVMTDPFQMRVPTRPSGRAPDLQVVLAKSLPRLKKLYMDGPADVVIEIISSGSRSTDRRVKFAEYEQAGVPEYWLIDPLRRQAEFYVFEKGHFIPADLDEKTARFHSRMMPGVWLDVEWLWAPPKKSDVLKKWKVK